MDIWKEFDGSFLALPLFYNVSNFYRLLSNMVVPLKQIFGHLKNIIFCNVFSKVDEILSFYSVIGGVFLFY